MSIQQSWWSKPLCCGLTRLGGGILLATMTILGLGAIAGLIVCVVLYVNGRKFLYEFYFLFENKNKIFSIDNVTDFQWKILGIVVCSVLLITVIITFFIFICCYQSGHIAEDTPGNGPRNLQSQRMSNYNDRPSVLRNGNTNYSPAQAPRTNATPIPPYNPTSMRPNDRLNYPENMNTQFRPRNLQNSNGLPVNNALGNVAYNYNPPINSNGQSLFPFQSNGVTNNNPNFVPYQELGLGNNYANGYPNQSSVPTNLGQGGIPYQMNPQTRLGTQSVQTLPQDFNGFSKQINTFPNSNISRRFAPPPGTRIEYIDDERAPRIIEKRTRRFIEHPEYDIVEEIIERPKPKVVREYVEVVEDSAKPSHIVIQRNGQSRYQNVPINSTQISDSPPQPMFDDLSTDRFYK